MQKGDLVRHKKFKGSIGFVSHRCTWTTETVWAVMWFYHHYDTGQISPVYDWEVEVIDESR